MEWIQRAVVTPHPSSLFYLQPPSHFSSRRFKRKRPPSPSSALFLVSTMANFAHLLPPTWKKHVQLWLEDDIPSYDIGGFVVGGA